MEAYQQPDAETRDRYYRILIESIVGDHHRYVIKKYSEALRNQAATISSYEIEKMVQVERDRHEDFGGGSNFNSRVDDREIKFNNAVKARQAEVDRWKDELDTLINLSAFVASLWAADKAITE